MNAERLLVKELDDLLSRAPSDTRLRLLDVGAGHSLTVARQLRHLRLPDLIDRIDIEATHVEHRNLGRTWQGSVECMPEVPSSEYDAVFANFVLEHVRDLRSAASEIRRVLKPGGMFVTTVPNTAAPEFLLARHTPVALHQLVRRGRAWETAYSYRSVADLVRIFAEAGLTPRTCAFFPVVGRYLAGYPVLGTVGALWDRMVCASGIKELMGEVCVVLTRVPRDPGETPAGDAGTAESEAAHPRAHGASLGCLD